MSNKSVSLELVVPEGKVHGPEICERDEKELGRLKLMELATSRRFRIRPYNYDPSISMREVVHGWWKSPAQS